MLCFWGRREGVMTSAVTQLRENRIVLVVGLDFDDPSEHLLGTVRELTRGSDEAELHVVHVVPRGSPGASAGTSAIVERTPFQIRCEVERLCQAFVAGTSGHVVVHASARRSVEELERLAGKLGADAIVVEELGHEARR
jgi:hypothetical protein